MKNKRKLRILMHTYELCDKINWKSKRLLESGLVVPSGCHMKNLTWKILMGLVLVSIGGQVKKCLIIHNNNLTQIFGRY